MADKKLVKMPLQPIKRNDHGLKTIQKVKRKGKRVSKTLISVVAFVVVVVGLFVWYNLELRPAGNDINYLVKITVPNGSTIGQVANQLQDSKIIRNGFAFNIYTRLSGESNLIKAGTYRLSPGESVQQIVSHLVKGSVDQFTITFYPGATLVDNTKNNKKYDVTTVFRKAGYPDNEIKTALGKTYYSPVFANKPTNASLEGYIYGETYNFDVGATVEDILQRTFDEFDTQIKKNNLVAGFAKQGLNLYQGITLASIIQREASNAADQRQVAQVFLLRLKQDEVLGSDVTYQYIADKTGVARDPNLDSPYNTRRFGGLPPGPISTPGLTSLRAVASPASGNYMYFLSGDDGVMRYAHTEGEHEANIVNYCKIGCLKP